MNNLDKNLIQKMEAGIRANGKLDSRRPRENKENDKSLNDVDNNFNRDTLSYGDPNHNEQEFLYDENSVTNMVIKNSGLMTTDKGLMQKDIT